MGHIYSTVIRAVTDLLWGETESGVPPSDWERTLALLIVLIPVAVLSVL